MKKTIQERFEAFHAENPHIYQELVKLTQQAYDRRREKIGIGMLVEVLRWNRAIYTNHADYKISNDFRSRYARLIMDENPHLRGIFNTKELTS